MKRDLSISFYGSFDIEASQRALRYLNSHAPPCFGQRRRQPGEEVRSVAPGEVGLRLRALVHAAAAQVEGRGVGQGERGDCDEGGDRPHFVFLARLKGGKMSEEGDRHIRVSLMRNCVPQ